jgi:phosphatidylinositol 4-kinase
MHLTNRKIYDLRERFTIDDIMINLNMHEEKGVSDFLINLMSTNPKILDKSFFYLNQLITMLSYKKYIYPYEQYICDKGICFIKFSVRISLYLNSFEKEHKGIRIMKFKIEQIMRANYSDIQDSQYQPKKKLKEDDFIITGAKNKNDMQVNYYYRCLEFFENLKKLCLLLFNYPIKLEGNTTDKKMTRKTALKEFIKLFNEDMDLMRGEEYDKMKKEEKINKKKNLNKTVYKNSKYNKGFILPFNNDKSNSDEHALIIVNILPEYSSPFSTKERVPVKLTCECIELGEAESENFFELYDNNKFFEKHNENILIEDNDNINLSLYSSNLSEVLEKQLSIFPKNDKIFDKWANLEKSLPLSKDELNKKDDKKIAMKETTSAFDDFVLLDFDIEQINPFGEPKEKNFEKIFKTSCFKKFSTYRVKCFIAKANDDMVQEMFALQLIKKFEEIFKSVNIFVKSYEVIITSSTSGLIEFLNNSSSIDGILKNIPKDWDLNKFFRYYFKGKDFAKVQENFANSLAGFCLLSYYLDIKDRHNGNIMINNEGRIMHIDFGFLLGTSPKNLGFERAQFKLVKSYVDILDGFDGKMFKHFKAQMVNGLIETKKYFRIISTMIQIMSHTNMPCLAGQNIDTLIDNLNKKFLFGYTKEQVEKYVDDMIYNNYENFWTRKYDQFQYWTNGILY